MSSSDTHPNSTVISSEFQPPPADSIEESLRLIDDLKFFLATAPANWQENQIIRRYYLNNQEGFISCVYWKNIYYITGTDIVRGISYKFKHFGRQIIDQKKFEEGIFSDLRSLKCGTDAVLENPRSVFLNFLQKNHCLKTQKKQKVFFWFSVPHDKLFSDALERDLKRELEGKQTATTKALHEPSLSFKYNPSKPLLDQVTTHLESKRQEKGLNDYFSNESAVESADDDDNDNDDGNANIIQTELDLSQHNNHNRQIVLDTPQDGITPLYISEKITSQEVTIPADDDDDVVVVVEDDDDGINNDNNDNDDDDDRLVQNGRDLVEDDFPLDYFQVADALQDQQDFLDPSVFFQSELSYQPLLIEQSEKLIKSAVSAKLNSRQQQAAAQQQQQAIQAQQAQQQQQQHLQLQLQQYYPSYEEYPNSMDYVPFPQQQQQQLKHQHTPMAMTQPDPYNPYLSYYQPYPQQQPQQQQQQQLQYGIPTQPPPPIPFNTFNPSYYEQAQQQILAAQQVAASLRGFPSSQATAPPPLSAGNNANLNNGGIPQLGVFTNNNINNSNNTGGNNTNLRKRVIIPMSAGRLAKNAVKKRKSLRSAGGGGSAGSGGGAGDHDTNGNGNGVGAGGGGNNNNGKRHVKKKENVKQEHDDSDFNEFLVTD